MTKMKTVDDNFVNTIATADSDDCEDQVIDSEKDPLADVANEVEAPKYYRLNEKVFAEPLTNIVITNETVVDCIKDPPAEITFVGSIAIQKRPGKRKKYFIDEEDVKNLTCPQQDCRKKFTSATLLKAHVRKVHCADRASYVCELCGAGFPARYLLNRHSEVHSDRKVKCPVCEKLLSLRTNMSTHLRSHSPRPHQCRCGKRFVRRSALQRHGKFVHGHGS